MDGRAELSALLPAGMYDVLAPAAEQEAWIVNALTATFAGHGYDRVDPPLIEFETTISPTQDTDLSAQTFRLMDPVSQRMMGLRSDMTMQMARIASTRLAASPRPLRLSYAGQVLRVRGSQMRPERQFTQVGFELIGSTDTAADAEAIIVAVRALGAAGVTELSVDLNSPAIVAAVLAAMRLGAEASHHIRDALDRKDSAALTRLVSDTAARETLQHLIDAAGPVAAALDRLRELALPSESAGDLGRLATVAAAVAAAAPDLPLTLDPVEYRGFEYQTGVSFAFFARDARTELGRGGRYAINGSEAATGVSLYLDAVSRVASPPPPRQRVLAPAGTAAEVAERLRGDGWVCIAGLSPADDGAVEARRLGCSHVLQNGAPRALASG